MKNENNAGTTDAATTEWEKAKPFTEMPTVTAFKFIRNVLPGGKYAKLDSSQIMLALKDEIGDTFRLKGAFGKPDFIITHNALLFEKVLRNEGVWPMRPGLEYLTYHRKVLRPDVFQGFEGLLGS